MFGLVGALLTAGAQAVCSGLTAASSGGSLAVMGLLVAALPVLARRALLLRRHRALRRISTGGLAEVALAAPVAGAALQGVGVASLALQRLAGYRAA